MKMTLNTNIDMCDKLVESHTGSDIVFIKKNASSTIYIV
jgi:hypothetical protein